MIELMEDLKAGLFKFLTAVVLVVVVYGLWWLVS